MCMGMILSWGLEPTSCLTEGEVLARFQLPGSPKYKA